MIQDKATEYAASLAKADTYREYLANAFMAGFEECLAFMKWVAQWGYPIDNTYYQNFNEDVRLTTEELYAKYRTS